MQNDSLARGCAFPAKISYKFVVSWQKFQGSFLCFFLQAANYLDIKGLLDVTCKTVANMIKGKTPEEIRKTFNIKNDFTEEEEAQVCPRPPTSQPVPGQPNLISLLSLTGAQREPVVRREVRDTGYSSACPR